MEQFVIKCCARSCEARVDPKREHNWIVITFERRNVKSVWWFCSPAHAVSMMAKALSEIAR